MLAGLFLLQHCSAIEIQMQQEISLSKKDYRVAILPFHIKGAGWGAEFGDAVGLHIAKKDRFVQVERGPSLNRLLEEQGFSQTGLIDASTRLKIGTLTSANLIIVGRGTALNFNDQNSRVVPNLVDTCTIKAIDVETGAHLITIRKKPGRAWTMPLRLKFLLSLSMIWNLEDVLVDGSNYDALAAEFADRIEGTIISHKAADVRRRALEGESIGPKNDNK